MKTRQLRIISEKCPFPAAELAEETLEDAYLYQTQDIDRIRSRRDDRMQLYKMELYKIFHRKIFWIGILAILGPCLCISGLRKWEMRDV